VRVVVFMWTDDPDGSPLVLSPGVAAVLIVTVAGTIVAGVYPGLLFELAQASAATLGRAPALGLR
jgi:NADH:ubiquinone oxidoreductase subunit 2 (subunit N)